jgi:hypothetical protein
MASRLIPAIHQSRTLMLMVAAPMPRIGRKFSPNTLRPSRQTLVLSNELQIPMSELQKI